MEKTISISFSRGGSADKTYAYKLAPSLHAIELEPGDKLVVQVGENESCMVGIVTEIHETPDPAATKWAFQLVDNELSKSLPRA